MKMLLHVCCGPCASGALPWWQENAGEVVPFFHNPNIHPFMEYRRRLTGAREVAERCGTELVADESYDPAEWFAAVAAPESGSRCRRCVGLRLERAAREAAARGCDVFSTSLSISPWQDHEAIAQEGRRAGELHGVEFIYQDLRPVYATSRAVSREWGIYRQKYCGCLLSEWERYRGQVQPAGGGGPTRR